MEVESRGGGMFSRNNKNKTNEPRPSRTLLLFDAVIRSLDERMRVATAKKQSQTQHILSTSLTNAYDNDENMRESWIACLRAQIESVEQLHQRYKWVLGQRQTSSNKEQQLLFGNFDPSQFADTKTTMVATLQAIKIELIRLNSELVSIEKQFESSYLGWLECGIHGLAGFARLSPGSIFRLILKHSAQKWESRIITGRQNKQVNFIIYFRNSINLKNL